MRQDLYSPALVSENSTCKHFQLKQSEFTWFCIALLCDWSWKYALSSQPIRCKIETNGALVTRVFPRFRQLTCFLFKLSLVIFIFTVIGCWVYLGCGWQHIIEKPSSVSIRDSMSRLVEVWLIYDTDTANSDRRNNSTSVQLDCYKAKNQISSSCLTSN